jgi:hypothetical protein
MLMNYYFHSVESNKSIDSNTSIFAVETHTEFLPKPVYWTTLCLIYSFDKSFLDKSNLIKIKTVYKESCDILLPKLYFTLSFQNIR